MGANVIVVDNDKDALENLKTEFPRISTQAVDFLNWDATNRTIQKVGHVDHLVNTVGVSRVQSFLSVTEDMLDLYDRFSFFDCIL